MARTTPNMGLTVWNAGTDFFSRIILAGDWDALDAHDHSPGAGAQIPTAGLANLAVTGPKIAAGAVDGSKLAASAVGATNIAPGAVGNTQLAVNAVDGSKVVNGTLPDTKLASPNNATYKSLFGTPFIVPAATAANPANTQGYIGTTTGGVYNVPDGTHTTPTATAPLCLMPLSPFDYGVPGKLTKARLAVGFHNNIQLAMDGSFNSFRVSLYDVSFAAGSSGSYYVHLGTNYGSTIWAQGPTAGTGLLTSADFTLGGGTGLYAFVVDIAAATPAGCLLGIYPSIQIRNT